MTRHSKTRLALVIDPRFSGGTSSAVAREIRVLAPLVDLRVYAIETAMFKGQRINPQLESALMETGLEIEWNPRVVRAEIVVIHNNSCLKFNQDLETRIICDRLFVVTHENFLRPNGSEGFDVNRTLELIEKTSLCRARFLAPVSIYNRRGVEAWLGGSGRRWQMADFDWFNICDFDLTAPNAAPADRRGRLSRPGFEKFPSLEVMQTHFPAHAEAVHILGGDTFLLDPETMPEHWNVLPFGAMPVDTFLSQIDFFVYYTHPQWRESFGRVIAEAIAAGKVVITDPGTAEIFGGAVIASEGADVDEIISEMLNFPDRYQNFVRQAQGVLTRFGSDAFASHLLDHLKNTKDADHALL